MSTLIITTEEFRNGPTVRYGLRFNGYSSKALSMALTHVMTGGEFTVRFTESNRNLRNIEWLFDGETMDCRPEWER